MHLRTGFRDSSAAAAYSSRASSASLTDDDDAITPVECDSVSQTTPEPAVTSAVASPPPPPPSSFPRQRGGVGGGNPPSPLSPLDAVDPARLWRRMLALQRRYHCYRSARIDAALESKSMEAAVPPRACLNLLNDSMAAQWHSDKFRHEVTALLVLGLEEEEEEDDDGDREGGYHGKPGLDGDYFGSVLPSPPSSPSSLTARTATGIRSRVRQQRRRLWRRRRSSE